MDKGDDLPEDSVHQVGNWKLGIIHGHQVVPWGDKDALSAVARRLDVDILVSGHTHKLGFEVDAEGRAYVNPGSLTGAPGFDGQVRSPSFMLLAIQENKLIAYQYSLSDEKEVKVSQVDHVKPEIN